MSSQQKRDRSVVAEVAPTIKSILMTVTTFLTKLFLLFDFKIGRSLSSADNELII